jgi:hypothetical protein
VADDGKAGAFEYVPAEGWTVGEYTFKAELYDGESLVQDTPQYRLLVTPEAVTKVVSWWTLGFVIGVAAVLSAALLAVVV